MPWVNIIAIIHLFFLACWGGIVATEAVVELYAFKKLELHNSSIKFHYWIDLLVELPVILGVIVTGITLLLLVENITTFHIVKLICAGTVISCNLFCIYIVFKRARILKNNGKKEDLWRSTRTVVKCAVVGIPFALIASILGFWLAYHRVLKMILG